MRDGAGYGDDPRFGGMLASESERLAAQAVLKQAYEDQRLTLDEFESRVGRAMAARTQGELAGLTRDIPAEPVTAGLVPTGPRRNRRRLLIGGVVAAALTAPAVAIGLTLASSSATQPVGDLGPPSSGPAGCPVGTPPGALAIANALALDPVYVDPGSSSLVTPAQAKQLRAEIGSLDSGRILVAALTPATVSADGGESSLANTIASCQADSQGVIMVTTPASTYLATSYDASNSLVNATDQAVNAAFNTNATFAAGIEDAVKRLAILDPGKKKS